MTIIYISSSSTDPGPVDDVWGMSAFSHRVRASHAGCPAQQAENWNEILVYLFCADVREVLSSTQRKIFSGWQIISRSYLHFSLSLARRWCSCYHNNSNIATTTLLGGSDEVMRLRRDRWWEKNVVLFARVCLLHLLELLRAALSLSLHDRSPSSSSSDKT